MIESWESCRFAANDQVRPPSTVVERKARLRGKGAGVAAYPSGISRLASAGPFDRPDWTEKSSFLPLLTSSGHPLANLIPFRPTLATDASRAVAADRRRAVQEIVRISSCTTNRRRNVTAAVDFRGPQRMVAPVERPDLNSCPGTVA